MSPRTKKPASSSPSRKPGDGSEQPQLVDTLAPELLARMAESVASARSSSDAIKDHLAIAQDLSRARTAFVSLFELSKGGLAVSAVRGRADGSVVLCKPGEGAVGRAFALGTLFEGDNNVVAVPLRDSGKPFGVLAVQGSRVKVSPALWQALADHLAAAMSAASVRDAAVRRTRDLETAVAGLKSIEQARDDLLGNVSHELKSPLTTVKAYLAMARKERLGPLTDKLRNGLEICDRNADRLLRLINDMLLMSRLQGGRMKLAARPFGLRGLAQEAAGALAAGATASGVTIRVERAGEVFVKGDRERALEAITHLIENGIVHNHPGGEVEVAIGAESGVAVLRVRDTGAGISPDDLPTLFDHFNPAAGATRGRASGLGLTIVRQIVQLHGGTIDVESTVGEGSVFTLKLPLFAGAVSLDPRASEPRDGSILLVEDDDDCREVLGQVLESEGLNAIPASSSDEALRLLANSRPALVLLDLRLGGSDGRMVLQHIRADERLAQTPVFVISGAADSAAGFRYDGPERIDGFFEKPLNLPRLLDRIREVVRPGAHASESA